MHGIQTGKITANRRAAVQGAGVSRGIIGTQLSP